MKNNIRRKKIICIIVIAILMFTTKVFAANDNFKTTLSVNNSQIKRGENVTVTIALSDIAIESGEKGIGAYTASVDFDHSILEYISTSGTDKWEAPLYQEGLIVGNTNDGEVVKTAQNIGTITFKVKEDAKLGETTIKLANFSGSTATTDVSAEDSLVTLTITDQNSGSGNQNENQGGNTNGSSNQNGSGSVNGNQGDNSQTQNEKNNSSNNKLNVGEVNKESTKQSILPKAGDTNIVICMLADICALVTIIIFIKIKLINRNIKRSM